MNIGAYLLTSKNNNNDPTLSSSCERFIKAISESMQGHSLSLVSFSALTEQPLTIFLIGSGGTATPFKQCYQSVQGPYFLLTTKTHNSLAASMEILSFLQEKGLAGEILHGTEEELARKLEQLIQVFALKKKLSTMRLGVLGAPNMLIASEADPTVLLKRTGIELVDISMEDFFTEIGKKQYEENEFTRDIKSRGYDSEEVEHALHIYGAIQRFVLRLGLQGVAVRCFDLLVPYNITGCLALAILNAQGVYAACEGDSRSLLSMVVLGELSGNPVFMANPSSIDTKTNSLVLAHCVLPLSMPKSYTLTTHFESGLGVAVKGELSEGVYTVFKCKEDMKTYMVQKAVLEENLSDPSLCRTQVRLSVGDIRYYLERPISNHHMICEGDHVALVDEFFRWI